jgi:hypothetical protein
MTVQVNICLSSLITPLEFESARSFCFIRKKCAKVWKENLSDSHAEKIRETRFPKFLPNPNSETRNYHRVEDDVDDWVVEDCLLGEHQRKHGVDRRDLL